MPPELSFENLPDGEDIDTAPEQAVLTPVEEARPEMKRAARRGKPGFEHNRTDLGNAKFFAQEHGDRVRYCYSTKTWHVWDSSRWKHDESGKVGELANATASKRFHDAPGLGDPDQIKREVAWALSSESAIRRRACIDQATTLPELGIDAQSFDADPWLLNVQNGTVDLRTGQLRGARREDYITKQAPVRFDATATRPVWDAFLFRIMAGDQDLIAYLRRLVGYILTGAIREHVFVVFYGLGANGKSTFIETLAALLGPEFSHRLCIESLLASKLPGNVTNPDLANLKGKRFAHTSETNRGRQLDEGLVKAVTGGDSMTFAMKYQNPVTFLPTHKTVMASNSKPTISGTDHGTWRRIHLVPFEVQIPKEERDLALPSKLLAELPGILNWAVQGCLEWQRQGLNPPQKVLAATEAYREESDALAEFFDEHCVLRPEAKVQAKDFYLAIKSWWEGRGEKPWSMKAVGAALLERGFTKRKSSGIWYDGVGLRATLGDDSTAPPPTNGRNGRVGDEFTKVLHEKASHEGLSETEFQPSHLPNPLLEASTSCPPPGSGTAPGLLRWLRSTYGVDVGLSSDGEPIIVAGEPHSGALSYIRSHRDAIAWHLSREGGEAA